MLLRAIPGPEGDKGAYYCKTNILLGEDFNAIPCTLLSGGSCLRRAGEPGTGLCRQRQGMTLGSGEDRACAPAQRGLSLWGRQEGRGS